LSAKAIATALVDTDLPFQDRQARVARLGDEFEQRISSGRLTDVLPAAANDPVRLAYERVRWRWAHDMRRAIDRFASGEDPAAAGEGRDAYLRHVDAFVALEERIAAKSRDLARTNRS
jgi:hypothetical protein